MGKSIDCCSLNCSFVKKDQNAQEFDGPDGNKNIRRNDGKEVLKAHMLPKEEQAKAITKWKPVEKELLLKL